MTPSQSFAAPRPIDVFAWFLDAIAAFLADVADAASRNKDRPYEGF